MIYAPQQHRHNVNLMLCSIVSRVQGCFYAQLIICSNSKKRTMLVLTTGCNYKITDSSLVITLLLPTAGCEIPRQHTFSQILHTYLHSIPTFHSLLNEPYLAAINYESNRPIFSLTHFIPCTDIAVLL